MPEKNIVIKGAREHNLKNVDLTIHCFYRAFRLRKIIARV